MKNVRIILANMHCTSEMRSLMLSRCQSNNLALPAPCANDLFSQECPSLEGVLIFESGTTSNALQAIKVSSSCVLLVSQNETQQK
jgi:hypothetical protein